MIGWADLTMKWRRPCGRCCLARSLMRGWDPGLRSWQPCQLAGICNAPDLLSSGKDTAELSPGC